MKNIIFILLSVCLILLYCHCNGGPQEIPKKFKKFIKQSSQPVEYKEILPFDGNERLPIPTTITKSEAFEDIDMFEYLWKTSYSGYEYWTHRGIDFDSCFGDVRDFVSERDSIPITQFEEVLSKILDKINDGHIALAGTRYNQAYRHKDVYYCDIIVEKSAEGFLNVIESQSDLVKKGDRFTEDDAEMYLFKTLSPTGKHHYLVGVMSFDPVISKELSFNDETIEVPFHTSRLIYARFDDPEPFYIRRKNNIPIVRVTGFADELYTQMKSFMNSGRKLQKENTIIINLMYNGGGSSVFPQGFIRNLNGLVNWVTDWAELKSPAIIQYFGQYDLGAMPDISPQYKYLIRSHKMLQDDFRKDPQKTWEFDSTGIQNSAGSYKGKLILLTNRRVLSAGEGMVGVSRSVKNSIIIGENTGGCAQFSSTCSYYLPNSKLIAKLPRQLILIPDLEECVGYLPDYWLDSTEPLQEVLNWLHDPEAYQFRYSVKYNEILIEKELSPQLPDNMRITPPGAHIPVRIKKFSGKWFGIVDGILEHMLVVEKIYDNLEVEAIYSWGVAYQWGIHQPGWQRYRGKIMQNAIVLEDKPSQLTITYTLNPDGTMEQTYKRPGVFSRSTMTKIHN